MMASGYHTLRTYTHLNIDHSPVFNMNILVLMTVIEVVRGLTREQYWQKADTCNLGTTGTSNLGTTGTGTVSSPTLIASLMFALSNNRPAVSYDAVSGTAAFHDGTSISTTSQDVYRRTSGSVEFKGEITDCADVNTMNSSGVYRVTPTPGVSFDVYCDMDTACGPWTVMHNRQNKDVDFYRKWAEYKTGFGNLLGNFWLGLWKLHVLTSLPCSLRIELEAWNGTIRYVEYSEFQIANESDNYRILVQGFSGNTADNMDRINVQQFTTMDRDNDRRFDRNCAVLRHGAWWYRTCAKSNLNGRYAEDNGDDQTSMYWRQFFPGRSFVPMKKARMLVKRTP